MSEPNSYETLGLNDASSFEEVQTARERLLLEHEANPQRKAMIEAAYDAILMERLRLRQEGKIKVPDRIRFAEKQVEATVQPKAAAPLISSPDWLQNRWDTPSREDILWPSVIFLSLALFSWFIGRTEASTVSVPLGLAVMACIYFINRKEHKFWYALLLTAGTLAVGLLLGFGVTALLTQQGVQLASGAATAIAATVTYGLLWFVSSFLR